MTTKTSRERKSAHAAAAVIALAGVTLGLLYFVGHSDIDVADVGGEVTTDLGEAASTLRATSEDAVTTAKVKTAFAVSKSVPALDIDVDSRRRVVTLTGSVPSADVEATAIQITRDTSGVVEVVDQLEVGEPRPPCGETRALENRLADAEIKALVYERFVRAHGLDAKGIDVLVVERVVTLTGTVVDEPSAKRAGAIADSLDSVHSVENNLSIANMERGTAAVPKPDEIVVLDVREVLESNSAIVVDSVEVEVHSGLVRLRGVVRSEAEKQLAEMLAGSTEGVVGVMNELEVS